MASPCQKIAEVRSRLARAARLPVDSRTEVGGVAPAQRVRGRPPGQRPQLAPGPPYAPRPMPATRCPRRRRARRWCATPSGRRRPRRSPRAPGAAPPRRPGSPRPTQPDRHLQQHLRRVVNRGRLPRVGTASDSYAWTPSNPPSPPMPECFTPPKGRGRGPLPRRLVPPVGGRAGRNGDARPAGCAGLDSCCSSCRYRLANRAAAR